MKKNVSLNYELFKSYAHAPSGATHYFSCTAFAIPHVHVLSVIERTTPVIFFNLIIELLRARVIGSQLYYLSRKRKLTLLINNISIRCHGEGLTRHNAYQGS